MSENTTFDNEIDDMLAKIEAAKAAGHELRRADWNIDQEMRLTSEYVEFDLCVNQESEISKIGRKACEVVNHNCASPSFNEADFDQCVSDFLRSIQSSRARLAALLEYYDRLESLANRYQRVTKARIKAQEVLLDC